MWSPETKAQEKGRNDDVIIILADQRSVEAAKTSSWNLANSHILCTNRLKTSRHQPYYGPSTYWIIQERKFSWYAPGLTSEKRKLLSQKILATYADRIPVIVEKATNNNLPELTKKKYLAPGDISVAKVS